MDSKLPGDRATIELVHDQLKIVPELLQEVKDLKKILIEQLDRVPQLEQDVKYLARRVETLEDWKRDIETLDEG